MTPQDFKFIRTQLGLTGTQWGNLLGLRGSGVRSTISSMEAGRKAISGRIAMLAAQHKRAEWHMEEAGFPRQMPYWEIDKQVPMHRIGSGESDWSISFLTHGFGGEEPNYLVAHLPGIADAGMARKLGNAILAGLNAAAPTEITTEAS